MRSTKFIHTLWYGEHPVSFLLIPLAWIYQIAIIIRRLAYTSGIIPVKRLGIPVIVVGNITAGGSGKTPLVIWLANYLKNKGYHPGIVSRGYGGKASHWPQQVRPDSDPLMVGDEPVIISRRTACPVAVGGPNRVSAAEGLIRTNQCDIIISDDGLQHLALFRDLEIAVVDSELRFGNKRCLPAGPLREPVRRLETVDIVVSNGKAGHGEFSMRYIPGRLFKVNDPGNTMSLDDYRNRTVHAVAGIGHPPRFFRLLRNNGIKTVEHAFPDHYIYNKDDLRFDDDFPVLMTEKDAVKCRYIADDKCWFLSIDATMDEIFQHRLANLLKEITDGSKTA